MLSGLPDQKAWGKKRKQFYGADVGDNIGELLCNPLIELSWEWYRTSNHYKDN